MSRIHFAWPLAALMGFAPSAQAAIRSVQYAGLFGGSPAHYNVINLDSTSDCKIVVANTGNTNQTILSISMTNYDPSAGTAILNAPMDSFHVDSLNGTIADCLTQNGTNNVIAPGGFCVFRSKIYNVGYDGQWTVCAGLIQVQDQSPAAPGSVVATGVINNSQEAQVMGGTLSGAYYASGTHVTQSTNVYTTFPAGGYDPGLSPYGYMFHNVNFLCAAACGQFGNPDQWCSSNCGQSALGSGFPGNDVDGKSHNIIGFFEPDRENFTAYNGDEPALGSYIMPSIQMPSAGVVNLGPPGNFNLVVGLANITPVAPGLVIPQGAPPNSLTADNMPATTVLRTANDHYAGGMVYEMNLGAMSSICSGNLPYWNQGGLDFLHTDSGDPLITVWDPTTHPNAPPERLFCSHRHGMPDLYMSSSSTGNFVINGGNPF